MEITVRTLSGDSYPLRVSPQDTVRSLKDLIQSKLTIPVLRQRLAFINTVLDDERRTLVSYGLASGSVVSLLVIDPPPFQVLLKNEKGITSTYDIKPDETVQSFKTKVHTREQVPVDQLRLIFEGKEMVHGTLADYGVRPLSTIYMTLRLRGGLGHFDIVV